MIRILLLWCLSFSVFAQPDILLLKRYQSGQAVTGWLMSEKLDGMRATWNGKQLISRGGQQIQAPDWFIKSLPPFALDGELWTKRDDFENLLSIVRDQKPGEGWHQVSYQIFEVPNQPGGLMQRLQILADFLQENPVSHLKIIQQIPCRGEAHLQAFLQSVLKLKGEGIVLRNPATSYETGRSANALKVKPYQDTECIVTGYKPGKGKYQGQVGALLCQMENGTVLAIGSGLTDPLRAKPPKIGQHITFKYYGLTEKGMPRHPVYWRERNAP